MFSEGDRRIVIIGGGATGVLLACHLLRDRDRRIAVTIVETSAQAGLGLAMRRAIRSTSSMSAPAI